MLNIDWDKVQSRYKEFWARENHDRPLLHITTPKTGGEKVAVHSSLEQRWFDTEFIISTSRKRMENTLFAAEAFPLFSPDLGPDYLSCVTGLELKLMEETTWVIHSLHQWKDYRKPVIDTANRYFKKMMELTKAALDDSKGDYFVGLTDLHPNGDALVAFRGAENACIDMLECPDKVERLVWDMFEVFKEFYDQQYTITKKVQEGTSNWMAIWHPGKWYPTSCDFSCMISPEHFRKHLLPEIEATTKFLDASIYHLDGPQALKHIDALLEIPTLNGIQWTYGAGQPTASKWIPILKKIQDADKLVVVEIFPQDVDLLLENIRPEGVFYHCRCENEDDANYYIKKFEV